MGYCWVETYDEHIDAKLVGGYICRPDGLHGLE